jgi:tetratricopeptide (TPR) repeat protein
MINHDIILLRLLSWSKPWTHGIVSPLHKGRDGMTLRTLLTGMSLLVFLSTGAHNAWAVTTDAKQIGQVHFPTSCGAEAQGHFDRAVALLHSFWFPEAIKAFHTVLATDSSCAMGYWGIAISLLGNPLAGATTPQALQEGASMLRQAKPVGVRTEREYDYLAAIALLYKDVESTDQHTRALAYEQAMERLAARYPDDTEAAIFYALALLSTAPPTDKTYTNQLRAGAILEKVFAQQPQHPGVAHYLIHSYDYPPLAAKGLAAARSYARMAPAVPYALHLPSHIFTRLGLWQESIATNRAAVMAAQEELRATPAVDARLSHALHAMDYMLYGHLQLAQDQAAKRIVEEVRALQTPDAEHLDAAYALAAIPARYALERRRWDEAMGLQLPPKAVAWDRFPQAEAVTVFARALGAARSGKAAAAQRDVVRLKTLHDVLVATGQAYWAEQVALQRQAVAAWVTYAAGKHAEAIKLMRHAVALEEATEKRPITPGPLVPARELLGELLLEVKQPAPALQAFEEAQRNEPNRFKGLYGAARAAELAGEKEKALAFYNKLVALAELADSERPELDEARTFLTQP